MHVLSMIENCIYCSIPGKHPWALKHNLRFWPTWALTRDIYSFYYVCIEAATLTP